MCLEEGKRKERSSNAKKKDTKKGLRCQLQSRIPQSRRKRHKGTSSIKDDRCVVLCIEPDLTDVSLASSFVGSRRGDNYKDAE